MTEQLLKPSTQLLSGTTVTYRTRVTFGLLVGIEKLNLRGGIITMQYAR